MATKTVKKIKLDSKKTTKKEVIDSELGTKLREAREKKGLTQLEASILARVSDTFFAQTERAEVNPSFAKLNRMFKAVGLKLSTKKN